MQKSVIVLGSGNSKKECPFDGEVWGVNSVASCCSHNPNGYLNKLFIAHGKRRLPPIFTGPDIWGHIDWNTIGKWAFIIDIITLHRIRGIKSKLYPLQRIIRKFHVNYFSNTICYMLAYAIYKKYDEIRIYGVDMVAPKERGFESGGIDFWIGYAMGRGIKIQISQGSMLLKTRTGKPCGWD